jgi:class 3 adenylate cyclase
MEKLASDETGPIVACPITRDECADSFVFDDLGEMHAKGFVTPPRLFALRGPR